MIPIQCQSIQDQIDDLNERIADAQAEVNSGNKQAARGLVALLRQRSNLSSQLNACIITHTKLSNLAITGIEITQAIQFFRPSVNIQNPCNNNSITNRPDNDVKMIAGKTTILRVYVNATNDPAFPTINEISGVVETKNLNSSNWNLPLTPYNANAPVIARAGNLINRKIADHTLNFRIPPNLCNCTLDAKITVFDSLHPGQAGSTSRTEIRSIDFLNRSPLQIRLVRIRYRNTARNLDIAAPTVSDFLNTQQFILRTFPIPGITIVRESEHLYDGDFTNISPGGNYPANQGTTGSILNILDTIVSTENFTNCVKYVAIFPNGGNQSGNDGWAIGRLVVSSLKGSTLAQELSHTFGRPHAPCGNPSWVDPCFPIYGTLPTASIGEIGFDYSNSNVFDPVTHFDFMSYCGPTWVSPYTYETLMNTGCILNPISSGNIQLPTKDKKNKTEYLHLQFTKDRDDKITVIKPAFHTDNIAYFDDGEKSGYFIELHDEKETILESKRLLIDEIYSSLDDASIEFKIDIPWHENAKRIVFKKEDALIHYEEIENKQEEVLPNLIVENINDKWHGDFNFEKLNNIKKTLVRFSHDNGKSWQFVSSVLAKEKLELNLTNFPGGDSCLIQVLLTTGFHTTKITSEPFRLKDSNRQVTILYPTSQTKALEGDSIHLLGYGLSSEGSVKQEELTWTSNINGFLGIGSEVIVHNLFIGQHIISLTSVDNNDNIISKHIVVDILPHASPPS